ncbi:hypothetical protein AVEN_195644-1 [Araneus ventricosus]|uniref:Uncharacterized protein n=1 Tax=Araneus ventricosus TaxID=182803 RepID=A0A4Y2BBD6_ARAVE|nr:hypothetical protein AVEN_195644-1 [Araneus ventricosus]
MDMAFDNIRRQSRHSPLGFTTLSARDVAKLLADVSLHLFQIKSILFELRSDSCMMVLLHNLALISAISLTPRLHSWIGRCSLFMFGLLPSGAFENHCMGYLHRLQTRTYLQSECCYWRY